MAETNLEQAREGVTACTDIIVDAFIERQRYMQHIASAKVAEAIEISPDKVSVIRLDREMELLKRYADRAENAGEDPEMVKNLVWHLMYAGKAKQLKILGKSSVFGEEIIPPEQLKQNLLELTRDVCASYKEYGEDYGATRLARQFGHEYIRTIAESIDKKEVAIDLGTADGTIARMLGELGFQQVVAFDVSPDMIHIAESTNKDASIQYQCVDLFDGIPMDDESADLIVANFGSASEVHPDILSEVARALRKGGKAFLSFYNSDSITSLWWQPTQNGVEVVLNKDSKILEVPIFFDKGPKVYKIYANPYSESEIRKKASELGLSIESMGSFSPAFTLTPSEFYRSPERVKVLESYEKAHYHQGPYVGFYITTVLSK